MGLCFEAICITMVNIQEQALSITLSVAGRSRNETSLSKGKNRLKKKIQGQTEFTTECYSLIGRKIFTTYSVKE